MKRKKIKSLVALLVTAALVMNEPLVSTIASENIETQTDETGNTEMSEESSQTGNEDGKSGENAESESKEIMETADTETAKETENHSEKVTETAEDTKESSQTETSGEEMPEETTQTGNTEEPTETAEQTASSEEPATELPEMTQTETAETESVQTEATETETEETEATETGTEETEETETETTETGTEETEVTETETIGIKKNAADAALLDELSVEALGFKTMDLSDEMRSEKSELSDVLTSIQSLDPKEDYAENELVYYADTREAAEQIAECYAGTITDYEYGVAVIEIDQNVHDAITLAADTEVDLPAVYPNIYYQISDDWLITEAEETADRVEDNEEIPDTEAFSFPYEDEHLYAAAPNDSYFGKQWYHDNMNTVEAWNVTKGRDVTVAVIDTGIDYAHPDLRGNIVGYMSTMGGDGRDDNGHGTHCSGIIAAIDNNGIGISGVAPEAGIYSVKVLGAAGRGSTGNITQGVIAATDRGVDVISMSLGGAVWDKMFQRAIDSAVNKGIVVIAAAGNESTSQKHYPAAYNNVISVAATDNYNRITYFSNYGSWVDIAAPGENILSTLPTNFKISRVTYESTGYGYMSGTSMACPAVAGTAALILAADQQLRDTNSKSGANKVRNVLIQSAVYDGAWFSNNPDKYYLFIDAEASVYALETGKVSAPQIFFSTPSDNGKVVTAGKTQYFELKTDTPHSKIYYTINGKKPTVKTGILYEGKIYMPKSGKFKIQAVAVVGNKSSKVFSGTYTFDVKAEKLKPLCSKTMSVAIGKSIQLGVEVVPEYTSKKGLEWSSSDTSGMIKVDKKGKVTCSKKASEGMEAIITAKTKDGSELSYAFTVRSSGMKSTEVILNAQSIKLSRWAHLSDLNMKEKGYVNKFKLEALGETTQYLYKSSNKKVADVDAYGNVFPKGIGTAKITVTANDGSGKKAVCKVTVVNPVFAIYGVSSTGYNSNDIIPIAVGCSVSIKTQINYGSNQGVYKPSNAKLEWSSSSDCATVKNGRVKCKSNAVPGTRFTVTARAKDGFGTDASFTFEVKDRITKMYIQQGGKKLTSASYKVRHGYGIYEPAIYVETKNKTQKFHGYFSVKISNKDVAYRAYDDYRNMCIWGVKPGTSKITYTAKDGSNKKFTIYLKVKK